MAPKLILLTTSGSKKKEPRYLCLSEAKASQGYAVSQIWFRAWIINWRFRVGNGIPSVCLAGVFYCASVSGHRKVKCIMESAVSCMILVIFGCL